MTIHSHIDFPKTDPATWEPRYRAALNTVHESSVFMKLAAEMEPLGEPLWAAFYDLATTDDAEFRAELLKEVEYDFASYAASEEYDEACYAYETRTGREFPHDRADWVAGAVRA